MLCLAVKALISGLLAAIISEIAKRSPAFGALVASLPLISIMAVIWLWRDTGDSERIASQMEGTFWYILPSLGRMIVEQTKPANVTVEEADAVVEEGYLNKLY